jgi:outer membrane biosynthesis protein TonB
MRSDWVISGAGHAALVLLGLVAFAGAKPAEDMTDYVPVSVITNADISQAAMGERNAHKPDKAKPLAEKIDQLKPVKEFAPKVVNKPDITTNATPLPAPKPKEKPEQKPKTKPEPKTARNRDRKTEQFKADKIAELLKKTEPPRRQKPTPKTPKYNANQIAELLDHREPQRQVATAAELNSSPSLGAPNAEPNAQLSQDEIDALRERIRECWSPPAGVDSNTDISVSLRVLFKPDGSLAQMPVVVAGTPSPLGPALAQSGIRALLLCQPFTMLKPQHYAQWKDITVDFDPRDLSGD